MIMHLIMHRNHFDDFNDSLKSKKKQRSKSATESLEIVALGRANGTILLYSLAHGDVWKTLEGTAHNQPTTDIVFAHGGRTAFSSSRDGWVVEWDIANGSVKS